MWRAELLGGGEGYRGYHRKRRNSGGEGEKDSAAIYQALKKVGTHSADRGRRLSRAGSPQSVGSENACAGNQRGGRGPRIS